MALPVDPRERLKLKIPFEWILNFFYACISIGHL
jgi:hypothetical protein